MNRAFKFSYLLNIVIQGFWCLLFPIGVAFGIGWLLVNKLSWPTWSMVPLLIVATFMGLFSMCKFLISSSEALERMEAEREKNLEETRRAYKERQDLEADLALRKRSEAPQDDDKASHKEEDGGDGD